MASKENSDSRSHASLLTVFINEILSEKGIKTPDLEAVAVSKGPGSYTGLRIGVSVAKGIAYASSIPLIGIDTTYSMFHGIQKAEEPDALYCPMIDARRMEIYYAIYDSEGNSFRGIAAEVITPDSFSDIPVSRPVICFGDGSKKLQGIIKRKNIRFRDNFMISAASLCIPANHALKEGKFEDIAYFEPFYLKDFIATKPVKNIAGTNLAW